MKEDNSEEKLKEEEFKKECRNNGFMVMGKYCIDMMLLAFFATSMLCCFQELSFQGSVFGILSIFFAMVFVVKKMNDF